MSILRSLTRVLRRARCPLPAERKHWVEERLRWLLQEFGSEPALRAPLLPIPAHLPAAWEATEDACLELIDRLSRFMLIPRESFEVGFYDTDESTFHKLLPSYESSHSGPAGLFQAEGAGTEFKLGIDLRGLDDPPALVATICHELGHVHLLGHGRLTHETPDHEETTDLLTVFFGAGIFTANSAFQFKQWHDGRMQGWSTRRLGYLSEEELAYALACFAWLRGERSPRWTRFLEPNIRRLYEDAHHYQNRVPTGVTLPFGLGETNDGLEARLRPPAGSLGSPPAEM